MLPRIACRQPRDACLDAGAHHQITQIVFPIAVGFRHLDLHEAIVANGLHMSSCAHAVCGASNDARYECERRAA